MGSHRVWYEASDPPGQPSSSGPEGVASVFAKNCPACIPTYVLRYRVGCAHSSPYGLWIRLLHHRGGADRWSRPWRVGVSNKGLVGWIERSASRRLPLSAASSPRNHGSIIEVGLLLHAKPRNSHRCPLASGAPLNNATLPLLVGAAADTYAGFCKLWFSASKLVHPSQMSSASLCKKLDGRSRSQPP